MSNQYINNSDIYQVNAERDIAVILSRFNTNFIYDCIENALQTKLVSMLAILAGEGRRNHFFKIRFLSHSLLILLAWLMK